MGDIARGMLVFNKSDTSFFHGIVLTIFRDINGMTWTVVEDVVTRHKMVAPITDFTSSMMDKSVLSQDHRLLKKLGLR